jgi:hypothetical protein
MKAAKSRAINYTCSRHDAKIGGDRSAEIRPIPGNFFAQETERRIGEWGNPPAWKTLEISLGT